MIEDERTHVLVLGANPAWQKTVACERMTLGGVVRVKLEATGAAGKGFNTARTVRAFGVPTRLVSAAGTDAAAWEKACAEEGLRTRCFPIDGSIRTATTVRDLSTRQVTEIVEEGPSATVEGLEILLSALAQEAEGAAVVVVAGTFPPGLACRGVVESLVGLPIPVVFDSVPALRALRELERSPAQLVLKLNEDEWNALFQERELDASLRAARRIWAHAWLLATRGARGAVLVDPEGLRRNLSSDPLEPEVEVNPIGAGDAFTGGMAVAMFNGESMASAAIHGMAVARASCSNPLPGRFSMEDVAISMDKIRLDADNA